MCYNKLAHNKNVSSKNLTIFSARCNIYISRLCHDASLSVHLSVTEVHWCIIANLNFKFRSYFTAHCSRAACCAACGRIISCHASQCKTLLFFQPSANIQMLLTSCLSHYQNRVFILNFKQCFTLKFVRIKNSELQSLSISFSSRCWKLLKLTECFDSDQLAAWRSTSYQWH